MTASSTIIFVFMRKTYFTLKWNIVVVEIEYVCAYVRMFSCSILMLFWQTTYRVDELLRWASSYVYYIETLPCVRMCCVRTSSCFDLRRCTWIILWECVRLMAVTAQLMCIVWMKFLCRGSVCKVISKRGGQTANERKMLLAATSVDCF